MTSGEQMNVSIDDYLAGLASHEPPPGITSDPPLLGGLSPVDQWVGVLTAAANAGDPKDNAQSAEGYAERDAKMNDAIDKFTAQDQAAEQELNGVAQQYDPSVSQAVAPNGATAAASTPSVGAAEPASAMAQQLPQAAASIAGALAGALGGALQPLGQIPQQIAQGAQQAMQTGMGLLQQAGGSAAAPVEDADLLTPLGDDLGLGGGDITGLGDVGAGGGGDLAGGGGGADAAGLGGGGLPGGTAPVSTLGPPPVPTASTAPSSSPLTQVTPPPSNPANPPHGAGMSGMPMVPPSALAGAGGADKDAKADTRRVSVPPVRNGAPVQGRLTTSPTLPPVVKKEDGAPIVTRRVVIPRKLSDERVENPKFDR